MRGPGMYSTVGWWRTGCGKRVMSFKMSSDIFELTESPSDLALSYVIG